MKESARNKKFIITHKKLIAKSRFLWTSFSLWNKVPVERYTERDVDAR